MSFFLHFYIPFFLHLYSTINSKLEYTKKVSFVGTIKAINKIIDILDTELMNI